MEEEEEWKKEWERGEKAGGEAFYPFLKNAAVPSELLWYALQEN